MDKFARSHAVSLLRALALMASIGMIVWSPSALADGTSIPYGGGGSTARFAQIVEGYNQSGELFRIEGHCQSACTMFLAIKNACVDRNATLLFHAGAKPEATALMQNSYNAALANFVTSHHYMDTPAFHAIAGSSIIHEFGYRECPRK